MKAAVKRSMQAYKHDNSDRALIKAWHALPGLGMDKGAGCMMLCELALCGSGRRRSVCSRVLGRSRYYSG